MLKENLKKIRQELGLSMAKFSEKLDIPAPTLICYERGERSPSAQLFMQLHIKLNINLNWFVTGNGEMFNKINLNELQVFKSELLMEFKNILNDMLKCED